MEPVVYLLIGLAIGALLGGVIGWLLGGRKDSVADSDLVRELREQNTRANKDTADLRDELLDARQALAATEARCDSAEALMREQRAAYERNLQSAREAQDKALFDLRDAFKALSHDALRETQPEFLRLANETFTRFHEAARTDLKQRQDAIAGVVDPLRQQLDAWQRRLTEAETAQSETFGKLQSQIQSLSQQSHALSSETIQLRRVLSSSQARGRWGEETLRRVVEAAGMSPHCDFTEQAHTGEVMPDLVVRLPGERVIIVDSKVPDLDFLEALELSDDERRKSALTAHARKLKDTIKALADKNYPGQFRNALDHVVLFLPAESLFSAALEGDHQLINWAAQRKILLATPASLIALLRSVSVTWQQHEQTENARTIAEEAQTLYNRVVTFTEHFDNLRKGLKRANDAFNEAVGSYDRMIRPSGERLRNLAGDFAAKDIPELPTTDGNLRLPLEEDGI